MLAASGCSKHEVLEEPLRLEQDMYLIELKPCSCPREFLIIPADTGFYERSLESSYGYHFVMFPTPEEFYNNRCKWQQWRFAYPLSAGKYRILDFIHGDTPYHYVEPTNQSTRFCCDGDYSHIILDNLGCYDGIRIGIRCWDNSSHEMRTEAQNTKGQEEVFSQNLDAQDSDAWIQEIDYFDADEAESKYWGGQKSDYLHQESASQYSETQNSESWIQEADYYDASQS